MSWNKTIDYKYPVADSYRGNAERCTFTFQIGPDQMPGAGLARDRMISGFISELQTHNAKPLRLQVWEYKAPVLYTNYHCVVTSSASPIIWPVVITAVLAIVFLIVLSFVIKGTTELIWGPGENGGGTLFGIPWGGLLLAAGGLAIVLVATRKSKIRSVKP